MSCTAHEANHSVHLPSKISLRVLARLSINLSPLSPSGLRTSLRRLSPKRRSAQLPACLHAAASDCLRSYAPARLRPRTASLHFAGCSRTSRLLPAVTHAVPPSWSLEVGSLGESMQRHGLATDLSSSHPSAIIARSQSG
jgi:hypothetical protein